jgi:hypothetical protein
VAQEKSDNVPGWAPVPRLVAGTLCWGVLVIVWLAVFDAINALVLLRFMSGGGLVPAANPSTMSQQVPLAVSAIGAVVGTSVAFVIGGAGGRLTRWLRFASSPWWLSSCAAMLFWLVALLVLDGGATFRADPAWLVIVVACGVALLAGQAAERRMGRVTAGRTEPTS